MKYATNATCICGVPIDHKVNGRQRKYCSDACRKAGQRHKDNVEENIRRYDAERYVQGQCEKLPAQVAQAIIEIQETYSVYAAGMALKLLKTYRQSLDN